jgi:hypothetical protein
MRCYWMPVIALSVIVFGASTLDSSAYLTEEAPLCASWEQGCAQLWGNGQGTTGNVCASRKRSEIARWITSLAPTIFAATGCGSARACTARDLALTERA